MSLFSTFVTANANDQSVIDFLQKYGLTSTQRYSINNYISDYNAVLEKSVNDLEPAPAADGIQFVKLNISSISSTHENNFYVLETLCTIAGVGFTDNTMYFFTFSEVNAKSIELYISSDSTESVSYTVKNNSAVLLYNNKTKLQIVTNNAPNITTVQDKELNIIKNYESSNIDATSSSPVTSGSFQLDDYFLTLFGTDNVTKILVRLKQSFQFIKLDARRQSQTQIAEFSIFLSSADVTLDGATIKFSLVKPVVYPSGFTPTTSDSLTFKSNYTALNYQITKALNSAIVIDPTTTSFEIKLEPALLTFSPPLLTETQLVISSTVINNQLQNVYDAIGAMAGLMDSMDISAYSSPNQDIIRGLNQSLGWDYTIRGSQAGVSNYYLYEDSAIPTFLVLLPPVCKIIGTPSYTNEGSGSFTLQLFIGLNNPSDIVIEWSASNEFTNITSSQYTTVNTDFTGTKPFISFNTPYNITAATYVRLRNSNLTVPGKTYIIGGT